MAAAQASPRDSESSAPCSRCGKPPAGDFLGRHVCSSCGQPRPLVSSSPRNTFFFALGIPERFHLDAAGLEALQRGFYAVSRALHPDRFTLSDAESQRLSLERMSFVNEAYRTLRDPSALRSYILELHGLKEGPSGQIPLALAESWFDLQDEAGPEKIDEFKRELTDYRAMTDGKIAEIETRLDSLGDEGPLSADYRDGLLELSRLNQELSYLQSLARDVERLRNEAASRA